MSDSPSEFIWWANDPRDGELTLIVAPYGNYKFSRITCMRIIAERVMRRDGSDHDKVIALELCLAPMGFIDERHYEEGSIEVITPIQVRSIALADHHFGKGKEDFITNKMDKILCDFILAEWRKARKT